MIPNARGTYQLTHQLPLLAKALVDIVIIRGSATKMQIRGGFLLPQLQQFTSTKESCFGETTVL